QSCLVAHRLQTGPRMGRRQCDAERRAAAGRAFHADVTRVLLDNSVRDSQPETGAATDSLCRVKRVVDLGDVFRRDAQTRIGDFNDQRMVFGGDGGYSDGTTNRNSVTRIQQQIGEHLLQLATIANYAGSFRIVVTNDLDL